MKDRVVKREVTNIDIVRYRIEHFISIFNVNSTSTNIVEDIIVNLTLMGSMNYYTTLMTVLYCIILE